MRVVSSQLILNRKTLHRLHVLGTSVVDNAPAAPSRHFRSVDRPSYDVRDEVTSTLRSIQAQIWARCC